MSAVLAWLDRNILSLGREFRLSYLPPLMVYLAAGVQGLTGIVGTFFVKEHLGLSAEFLATLAFWVGIPWALKMPLGHLTDLLWRHKDWLVYLGALLIAASLSIMAGLVGARELMAGWARVEVWYVLAALLAPIGYVLQDAVADAMTAEAVPRFHANGRPRDPAELKLMHATMQTLGRVAIIGGTVLVALINLTVFAGTGELPVADRVSLYLQVYLMALVIPVLSVSGVVLAAWLRRRALSQARALGLDLEQVRRRLAGRDEDTLSKPNAWLLGGSLVFVVFTVGMGLSDLRWNQEIIFAGSLLILVVLIRHLMQELDAVGRATLVATAFVLFMFRATPGPGPGLSWFNIDELGFDPAFFSVLSLIASTLTLAGMFIFRRFMAERSILQIIVILTLAGGILFLPTLGLVMGVHEWTARMTGGIVDARFIAIVDTALESPLGQIAMIPMLAWIASTAPPALKATFFAVMSSLMNLALSASALGTKYLNQVFTITREVKDPATGLVKVAADYTELLPLLLVVLGLGLAMPLVAVAVVRRLGWPTA